MEPITLIARVILARALYLINCMAIEAYVLRKNLDMTPRSCVIHAAAINLFAEVVGYFVFFTIFFTISTMGQANLLAYLAKYQINELSVNLLSINLFYFILYGLVKWLGFELFRALVDEPLSPSPETTSVSSGQLWHGWVDRFKAILRGHTISFLIGMFLTIVQVALTSR
ncbi:MAG: hypothetical protein ACFBSC_11635 [Microcoleaceae cyanobacterium]